MVQYIDKSAVIAEIERRIEAHKENLKKCDSSISEMVLKGSMSAYQSFLHFLNTLEVKDADLVEEIDYEDYARFFKEHPEYNDGSWGFEETWTFAQYCYKLGLKAQKGE